jgi:hypothetical protein
MMSSESVAGPSVQESFVRMAGQCYVGERRLGSVAAAEAVPRGQAPISDRTTERRVGRRA